MYGQDKSVRLNGKTKVYVKMARLNCTFKCKDKSVHLSCNCIFRWKDKSVHLNCECIFNGKQMCTFKWEDKSVRLNGRTKVYV